MHLNVKGGGKFHMYVAGQYVDYVNCLTMDRKGSVFDSCYEPAFLISIISFSVIDRMDNLYPVKIATP